MAQVPHVKFTLVYFKIKQRLCFIESMTIFLRKKKKNFVICFLFYFIFDNRTLLFVNIFNKDRRNHDSLIKNKIK
jgi:hypothetical protein